MAGDASRAIDDESTRTEADRRSTTSGAVTFTVRGAREGFVDCLPIAVGVASYGVAFGIVATQAGLSVAEAVLMSATVLAGAAQLIAVELWADGVPAATIVLTTLLVNLRYVLMSASLQPWFAKLSPLAAYGSVFFTADENWALTMGELTAGRGTGAYLLGSGFAIWVLWVAATVAGAVAGGGIGDPSRYGLDFVFAAVFVALAVELWDGRADLLPWVAAFVAALGSAAALPGRWYVLLGALAGCAVGLAKATEPNGGDEGESESEVNIP